MFYVGIETGRKHPELLAFYSETAAPLAPLIVAER